MDIGTVFVPSIPGQAHVLIFSRSIVAKPKILDSSDVHLMLRPLCITEVLHPLELVLVKDRTTEEGEGKEHTGSYTTANMSWPLQALKPRA